MRQSGTMSSNCGIKASPELPFRLRSRNDLPGFDFACLGNRRLRVEDAAGLMAATFQGADQNGVETGVVVDDQHRWDSWFRSGQFDAGKWPRHRRD